MSSDRGRSRSPSPDPDRLLRICILNDHYAGSEAVTAFLEGLREGIGPDTRPDRPWDGGIQAQ
ncbi:hypothetical protein [Streptomyces nymphaeiformis]|uniref:Uncharacterized protein n=1 Tax=Streptomyces nymphaeiformis TaxID=2663842 RepID=A0A7W7XFZ7_9ACTN|nr:hypothetical protein [Streptomyces nymphaeiformis]MBB4986807.1 hypothetical protein [Streptomyces nymphaeiformis]